MQAQDVTYGPYSLVVSLLEGGGMQIRRQDPDHKRTVATVDSLGEWDAFVAALKNGSDEVAAVHAIDEHVENEVRRTAYDAWNAGGDGAGRWDLDDPEAIDDER